MWGVAAFCNTLFDCKMKIDYFTDKYRADFISSRSNGTIVSLSKLSDKKYRDESRLFLSEGIKLAEEALLHSEVAYLILCETAAAGDKKEILALADSAHSKGVHTIVASEPAFAKLSSEKAPQGVIAVSRYMDCHVSADTMDFSIWQKDRQIILLDNIQDPGNLGTIIRSAAAMGFYGIVTINCADIYSAKVLRASMGAIFRCNVYQSNSPIEEIKLLQKKNRRVLAAALGEISYTLGEINLMKSDCIVIGNEGHGIDEKILSACDAALKIPMTDGSESLNAAAAAAIIMWEYHRNFK